MQRLIGVLLASSLCICVSQKVSAQNAAGHLTTTVYTPQNAPAAPRLEDLPLRASVSQYGITWTFAEPARVGQFINGDYYIVGPVTVTAIDPAPRVGAEVGVDELDANEREWAARGRLKPGDRVRNGSMVNPPAREQVAYDSGIRNYFTPRLVSKPPYALQPGDALVSTISLRVNEKNEFPYEGHGRPAGGRVRGVDDNSPVKIAAILTCVTAPQPADAFRSGLCDRKQVIYLARNLKRDLLKSLPQPRSAPRLATWVRIYERPWVNPGIFGFEQPMNNMPLYGQWVGQAASVSALLLMLDYPAEQKEALLIRVMQVGLDYWSMVKGGHPGWEGWGGHGSGRKFPIVFAGLLLGDAEMAAPTIAFPKVNFGEDNQTAYGTSWTGAQVVFAGHSGIHADGSVPRRRWGPYEHLHPSEWNKEGMAGSTSEAYRRANTSTSWVGQALIIHMLGAHKQWNHPPFFDYVDRWMFEEDTEFRREVGRHLPGSEIKDHQRWAIQGQAWEPFVTEMWSQYRQSPGMPPIDGWKQKHDDAFYRQAVEKVKAGAPAANP